MIKSAKQTPIPLYMNPFPAILGPPMKIFHSLGQDMIADESSHFLNVCLQLPSEAGGLNFGLSLNLPQYFMKRTAKGFFKVANISNTHLKYVHIRCCKDICACTHFFDVCQRTGHDT